MIFVAEGLLERLLLLHVNEQINVTKTIIVGETRRTSWKEEKSQRRI